MRASWIGWESVSLPSGFVGSGSSRPSARAFAVPASIPRSWSSEYPATRAVFSDDEERRRLLPVRVVARVDDLLGRDLAIEVEEVDRAPRRGVEQDALAARHAARERGEVGDPAVGDDQRRARVVGRRGRAGPRRSAAARGRRGSGSGRAARPRARTPAEPVVVRRELLGARVQLDPAGAEVEGSASPPRSATRSGRGARRGSAGRCSARRTRASGRSRRVNDGSRSGSSRQNMNAREMP